jgi:hypothetical protein
MYMVLAALIALVGLVLTPAVSSAQPFFGQQQQQQQQQGLFGQQQQQQQQGAFRHGGLFLGPGFRGPGFFPSAYRPFRQPGYAFYPRFRQHPRYFPHHRYFQPRPFHGFRTAPFYHPL